MLTKEKVIESIKLMQEPFSIDELIERMLVLKKVEIALEQSAQGRGIPDEELDAHLPEWLR